MGAYLALLEKLLAYDIDILAHPLRVFRRAHLETPASLFDPVAELLAKPIQLPR